MDLKNLTVFSLANKNMQYLSARQRVLAANIANASTPNYLAQDVEKPSVLQGKEEVKHANLTLHTTMLSIFLSFYLLQSLKGIRDLLSILLSLRML